MLLNSLWRRQSVASPLARTKCRTNTVSSLISWVNGEDTVKAVSVPKEPTSRLSPNVKGGSC